MGRVERVHTARTKGVGTPLWMAPEIIAGTNYGPSADVYSFGVVMWEIASREEPWREVEAQGFLLDTLLRLIRSGRRPGVGAGWPHGYVGVMQRCWATAAGDRPTFAQVVGLLGEREVDEGERERERSFVVVGGGGDV